MKSTSSPKRHSNTSYGKRSTQPTIPKPASKSTAGSPSKYNNTNSPKNTDSKSPLRSSGSSTSSLTRSARQNSSLRKTRPTTSYQLKSFLNDPVCISQRKELLEDLENYDDLTVLEDKFEEMDENEMKKLITHLKEYEQQNAIHENYKEAAKTRKLYDYSVQLLKKRNSNEFDKFSRSISTAQSKPRSATATNREEVNTDFINPEDNSFDYEAANKFLDMHDKEMLLITLKMNDFDRKHENKLRDYNHETQDKILKLKQVHDHQMEELDEKWNKVKPAKYRKPSAQLLQLKEIEKNLALAGEYDRAEIIHAESENLTKQETKVQQERLVFDYKQAKSQLMKKQEYEMSQLIRVRNDGVTMIQNEYTIKRQQFINRENVLMHRNMMLTQKRVSLNAQSLAPPAPSYTDDGSTSNLLPELFAPNDPEFIKEEERKEREKRKQSEKQRKTSRNAMWFYPKQEEQTTKESSVNQSNKNLKQSPNLNESNTRDNENVEIKVIPDVVGSVINTFGENKSDANGVAVVDTNNKDKTSTINSDNDDKREIKNEVTEKVDDANIPKENIVNGENQNEEKVDDTKSQENQLESIVVSTANSLFGEPKTDTRIGEQNETNDTDKNENNADASNTDA